MTFDLDPCHPIEPLPWVPAREVLTRLEDGLATAWPEGHSIWLNPPYGPALPKWLVKMAEHRRGIALVFSRTDTSWFHDLAASANAILFLQGRVRFCSRAGVAGGTPGCGSMLLAWGADMVAALERFEQRRGGLLVKGRART